MERWWRCLPKPYQSRKFPLNNNQIKAFVTPNQSELLARPHVENGRCWCKTRVPLMSEGKKVGEGTIDHTGLFIASISSDELAKEFSKGIVESLSISTKLKAPEVSVVETLPRF